MRDVIVGRERIDEAAAREGKARLSCEVGQGLWVAEAERMIPAVEETGTEEAIDVGRLDRAVGDAPRWCLDLDHGLQPEQAARAGPHDG